MTTLASAKFNRSVARAKELANAGLVFITNRGKPTHVLLSMEEYCRMMARAQRLGVQLDPAVLAEIGLTLSHEAVAADGDIGG